MNIIERLNEEVSIYSLFDSADPPVKYKTDKKPCQISCPFHGQDSRPSARVYPDTNSFRCYYCSRSWGPVTFWAQANSWYKDTDKLDIGRAIDDLCTRYNISDNTFDWQRKFYGIKAESEKAKEISIEERRLLQDYYSWSISKAVHTLTPENRDRLEKAIILLWQSLDKVNLREESWELDLKNWYEDAKITVNDVV